MSSFEMAEEVLNVSFYTFLAIALFCGLLLLIRIYMRLTLGTCTCKTSMNGKTVIITGANRGIGKETALQLARHGAKIIMACRCLESGESAAKEIIKLSRNNDIIVRELDLCSFRSVRNFANTVLETENKIDVLINNAGILGPPSRELTVDECELIMQTNYLGHFLLTNLLLGFLKHSAPCRIINVTSNIYCLSFLKLDDLQHKHSCYNKWWVYSNSKMASILFTQELSRRLEGTGVTANCLHPGVVSTDFLSDVSGCLAIMTYTLSFLMRKNAMEGAQTAVHLALAPGLESVSGEYFSECKQRRLYRKAATSRSNAEKLWTISEKIVGLGNK